MTLTVVLHQKSEREKERVEYEIECGNGQSQTALNEPDCGNKESWTEDWNYLMKTGDGERRSRVKRNRCVMIHIEIHPSYCRSVLCGQNMFCSRFYCVRSYAAPNATTPIGRGTRRRKKSSLVLDHLSVFVYSLLFRFFSIHSHSNTPSTIGWIVGWPWLLLPHFSFDNFYQNMRRSTVSQAAGRRLRKTFSSCRINKIETHTHTRTQYTLARHAPMRQCEMPKALSQLIWKHRKRKPEENGTERKQKRKNAAENICASNKPFNQKMIYSVNCAVVRLLSPSPPVPLSVVAWEPLIYAAIFLRARVCVASVFVCKTTCDECTKNLWFSKQINKKQKKRASRAYRRLCVSTRSIFCLHHSGKHFRKSLPPEHRQRESTQAAQQSPTDVRVPLESQVAAMAAAEAAAEIWIYVKRGVVRLRERSTNRFASCMLYGVQRHAWQKYEPKMMNNVNCVDQGERRK